MPSLPFDLNRFRRIFDPVQQSQGGSHGGWETENPPLPPYPLNPPFAPNMQPPPMLQAPPEPPPPEPMVGPPQRTPQTPLNPPRTPPMTSSPRTTPQPPFPAPQGQSPLDFPPGGPQDPNQFDIGADIRQTMPPRPPMPTGEGLPQRPAPTPIPESAEYPYLGIGGEGTLGGPNWPDEEPIPGLSRGGGGSGLRTPSELKPGTITNENMGDVPDFPDWYNRPSLNMGPEYDAQPADISDQAQANAPDQWFGQEGPQMPQSEEEEINQAISQWKPQTQMQQRLDTLLSGFPQREQNFSKWRKLGSFITGAGLGPEAQERATYAPFYRQLGDWQAQMEPALKGAELERQGNINLRQLIHNEAMERVANRRASTQEDAEARRERVRLDNVAKEQRKAQISEMKANDDNWVVKADKQGNIFMIHPRLGKRDMQLTIDDVTEEQKHRWKMEEIGATAAARRANQRDRWSDYDAYPADGGPPVRMSRNLDTNEVIQLPGEAVGPKPAPSQGQAPAQAPTAPPTQAPTQQPAQAPTGQFPSLTGVNSGFGPPPSAQAPAQAPSQAPVAPAYGKPQSDSDVQKGLETQVSRAKQQFPEYEENINWNETTQLPEWDQPSKAWFSDAMVPYDWATYDRIGKFIFGPSFKRFTPLEQQITGTPDNRPSGSTGGNTRTTSRGTTVTRID